MFFAPKRAKCCIFNKSLSSFPLFGIFLYFLIVLASWRAAFESPSGVLCGRVTQVKLDRLAFLQWRITCPRFCTIGSERVYITRGSKKPGPPRCVRSSSPSPLRVHYLPTPGSPCSPGWIEYATSATSSAMASETAWAPALWSKRSPTRFPSMRRQSQFHLGYHHLCGFAENSRCWFYLSSLSRIKAQ